MIEVKLDKSLDSKPFPASTDPTFSPVRTCSELSELKSPAFDVCIESEKKTLPDSEDHDHKTSEANTSLKPAKIKLICYAAPTVAMGLVFNAFEWIQNLYGPDSLGWLTSNTGNFCSTQAFQLPMAVVFKAIGLPKAAEIITGLFIAINILGETVLPQVMPPKATPDVWDIPLGITGALVGYFGILKPLEKFDKALKKHRNQ